MWSQTGEDGEIARGSNGGSGGYGSWAIFGAQTEPYKRMKPTALRAAAYPPRDAD
jgi:hypothetical protein